MNDFLMYMSSIKCYVYCLVKLTVSKPQTVAKGKTYLDLNEGRSIVSNIKMTEIVFKLKNKYINYYFTPLSGKVLVN